MASRRKQLNTRDLKKEARSRFELFIANELTNKADVETHFLARDFYKQEETLLKKIAHATLLNILVKWADDILNQSCGREAARNGQQQLTLPMSLQGIELPGAISFISGGNHIKFVANYKVVGWQMESHAYILRKRDEETHASRLEFDRLHAAVKPHMDADPELTLPKALQYLIDQESGAA